MHNYNIFDWVVVIISIYKCHRIGFGDQADRAFAAIILEWPKMKWTRPVVSEEYSDKQTDKQTGIQSGYKYHNRG